MAAARYQVARVARARHLDAGRIAALVDAHTAPQYFGFFGEARVNVQALNLALDAKTAHTPKFSINPSIHVSYRPPKT